MPSSALKTPGVPIPLAFSDYTVTLLPLTNLIYMILYLGRTGTICLSHVDAQTIPDLPRIQIPGFRYLFTMCMCAINKEHRAVPSYASEAGSGQKETCPNFKSYSGP